MTARTTTRLSALPILLLLLLTAAHATARHVAPPGLEDKHAELPRAEGARRRLRGSPTRVIVKSAGRLCVRNSKRYNCQVHEGAGPPPAPR
mmetsp:Transcript_14716/g.37797  ORF Transcript_14716/g.37797 Transcript_14716/m.37797 type:complete len:91 (-) Transcript_14716:245-517(-)